MQPDDVSIHMICKIHHDMIAIWSKILWYFKLYVRFELSQYYETLTYKNTKKQCFSLDISDGFLKFLKSVIIIYFSMIQRQYTKTNQISQKSWDKSVQTKEQISD